MKKLTPIKLEDGTVIYMEVKEDIEIVSDEITEDEGTRELTREDLGKVKTKKAGEKELEPLKNKSKKIVDFTMFC